MTRTRSINRFHRFVARRRRRGLRAVLPEFRRRDGELPLAPDCVRKLQERVLSREQALEMEEALGAESQGL